MLIHICQILGRSFCLKIRVVLWADCQLTAVKICQTLTNKKMTTQEKKTDFVLLCSKILNYHITNFALVQNFTLRIHKLYTARFKTLKYNIINFELQGSKLKRKIQQI